MTNRTTSASGGDHMSGNRSLRAGTGEAQRQRKTGGKLYDFRQPDKVSKEHLRALQTLHETFGRLASSTLSSHLRLTVRFDLLGVDQVTYGEFVDQLSTPTAIHVITLDPLPGQALMNIDLALALGFIDRLLGGSGRPLARTRELTEIETNVLRKLMNYLMAPYAEAWEPLTATIPKLVEMALNPEYVQVALRGDAAVLLRFQVLFAGREHGMSLCLPHATLESVLSQMSRRSGIEGQRQNKRDELLIADKLMQVTVPVVAVLGRTHIELRDLLDLEAGNIVTLDTRTHQSLDVLVADQHYGRAVPGQVGQHMAVRISEFDRREE